ncbi:hypothetical protein [Lacinutrix jangbogonensis]|uniref:hypothetical protein n=1 Tax=Lacinutrix jangbogonensis TaxID=1469557 RepID=UPI0012E07342|nr:hypothetical protein [Lacinutrix jangbogonensis]
MNLPSNIGKSTLLATCVFWIINFTEEFDQDILGLVLLSIIPICICVTLVIILTICPVFWFLKKEDESNYSLAKRCFPYYIILMFGLCALGATTTYYELYFISFLVSAFITTAQSWVWFTKEKMA